MAGKVYIGVSGWRHAPWRGHFYPQGLALTRELEYASPTRACSDLYNSRYCASELQCWARCIRAWTAGGQPPGARLITQEAPPARAGRDVCCYFDNTDKRHAPDNARADGFAGVSEAT